MTNIISLAHSYCHNFLMTDKLKHSVYNDFDNVFKSAMKNFEFFYNRNLYLSNND
jgi:hypothetical protein